MVITQVYLSSEIKIVPRLGDRVLPGFNTHQVLYHLIYRPLLIVEQCVFLLDRFTMLCLKRMCLSVTGMPRQLVKPQCFCNDFSSSELISEHLYLGLFLSCVTLTPCSSFSQDLCSQVISTLKFFEIFYGLIVSLSRVLILSRLFEFYVSFSFIMSLKSQ